MTTRDPERGEPDLDHLFSVLADEDARVRAPADLGATVMAAWDARREPVQPRRSGWASRLWLGRAAAVAAAAVLAVAWLVARATHGGPEATASISHTTLPIDGYAANLMAGPPLETESLQLVRVRMPRGALRAFGIALVDPEATGEVEVDVIVGEDGFPRSIRRVRPIPAGNRQESDK